MIKNEHIETLLDTIAADYENWSRRMRAANDFGMDDFDEDMAFFRERLVVEEGRKYLKIIRTDSGRTVWGFIVKGEDKKFNAGDILKPAGWKAPARNQARGNIIEGGYDIRWTGPLYL